MRTHKIVHISDIHEPFRHQETIEHLIENHGDADHLVIGGDWFDSYCLSTFGKAEHIDLMTEYNAAVETRDRFLKTFPRITVFGGNHDFRWQRQVKSNASLGARKFLVDDMLRRLCRGDTYNEETKEWTQGQGFSNLKLMVTPDKDISWFWFDPETKILYAHSERFVKATNGVAQATMDFFVKKGYYPQAVVVGHVHRLNISYLPHCIMIESGCACKDLDYAKMHPKLQYTEQSTGYAVITVGEDMKIIPDMTHLEATYQIVRKG